MSDMLVYHRVPRTKLPQTSSSSQAARVTDRGGELGRDVCWHAELITWHLVPPADVPELNGGSQWNHQL